MVSPLDAAATAAWMVGCSAGTLMIPGPEGGAPGILITTSSMTVPLAQVTSSPLAAWSQMAWSFIPVLPTSTLRWDRWRARYAVRASVPLQGVTKDDPAPTVTWVTPRIGW